MDSLDRKHAKSVLLALYGQEKVLPIVKSKLNTIVKSHQVLDTLLNQLKEDSYITIIETKIGPPKYNISLTDKGRQVAEQLKNAELAAQGRLVKSFFSRPQQVLIFLGKVGRATVPQIKEEIPGAYDDLEELRKIKLITSKIEEKNGSMENLVMLTEKGEEIVKELEKCEDIVKR